MTDYTIKEVMHKIQSIWINIESWWKVKVILCLLRLPSCKKTVTNFFVYPWEAFTLRTFHVSFCIILSCDADDPNIMLWSIQYLTSLGLPQWNLWSRGCVLALRLEQGWLFCRHPLLDIVQNQKNKILNLMACVSMFMFSEI